MERRIVIGNRQSPSAQEESTIVRLQEQLRLAMEEIDDMYRQIERHVRFDEYLAKCSTQTPVLSTGQDMWETERHKVEKHEGWRALIKDIPSVRFPADWDIQVIPPFAGAMARFIVTQNDGRYRVSVYLDTMDRLAVMARPYWEIYPVAGDVARVNMENTETLLQCIQQSLIEQQEEDDV